MKKGILSPLLCMAMAASLLAGCAANSESKPADREKMAGEKETSDVKADPVDQKKVYVSPDWVQSVIDGNQKESSDYVILECAWGEEADNPAYTEGHIKGAYHMNTDDIESEEYWNIRTPEEIKKLMADYGITKDTTVICYGADGVNSADDRVAFTLLWAGVENVKCLDGGLEAWTKSGYAMEKGSNKPKANDKGFGTTVPAHPEYIITIEDVKEKLENDSNFKLVSIRSKAEFSGETSGYGYIDKAGGDMIQTTGLITRKMEQRPVWMWWKDF